MKKLMKAVTASAVALVASGAFASLPSPTEGALGFEAFEVGKYTVSGFVEKTDAGQTGSGDPRYWYAITNASQDASAELATIVEGGAAGGNKYLAIEAQAPLYRTINASGTWGSELSGVTAEDIPPSGIYLDTMVKFTVSTDEFKDGDLDAADKLAITCYSADDSNVTNIIVRAGYVDGSSITPTNYVMTLPANFNVDAWHRLTVRAIADVGSETAPVGFAVYLDQTLLTYDTGAAGDSDYVGALNAAVTQNLYKEGTHALLPSLVAGAATGSGTLTAVGFKGTGSLDDIQFTDEKPDFIVEGIAVSIAWDADVATYTVVDSNKKTLVDAAATSGAAGSTNLTLDAGVTTLTVTARYAEGYEAGIWTVTGEGAQISGSTFTVANGAKLSIVSMLPKFDVGGTHYGSFADALTAAAGTDAESMGTIKLLTNVTGDNEVSGWVTIDLAGKTLTGTKDGAIINNGAHLFVTNSTEEVGHVQAGNATQAVLLTGGYTTIYAGWFDGEVFVDGADDLSLYGGFYLDSNSATTVEDFYLNAYAKDTVRYTGSNSYFTVGGEAPLTGWAAVLGEAIAEDTYGIDNLTELKAFQANVGAESDGKLATAGLTFKLTADIALDAAWEGIGLGEKDDASKDSFNDGAFRGTFDGQNHTISNFQMENGTDYGAFFKAIYQATIKNLKISWGSNTLCANSSSSGDDTGATFVGIAKESTLQNLTALAGTVTTVSASKDMAGIVGYLMKGSTVDSCTNELNIASLKSASRKCGGIAIITQNGSGEAAIIQNCKNSGTVTAGDNTKRYGAFVGYLDATTTVTRCENTAAVPLVHCFSSVATVSDTKSVASVLSYTKEGGTVNGLNFATVDGTVATFVADNALALNGSYKVMATGATATFAFAEAGTIAFDTALATPTYEITAAQGLTLTDATSGTVKTYTAAAQTTPVQPGGNDGETYNDAQAATNAAEKVVVAVPSEVSGNANISQAEKEAYVAMFEAKVVPNGDNGYKVEVVLKDQIEAAIQEDVDDATETALEEVLKVAADTAADVKVTTKPGLYYQIVTSDTLPLPAPAADKWVMATEAESTIQVTKPADNAAFFKVYCTPAK